jgi:hypothetical protein
MEPQRWTEEKNETLKNLLRMARPRLAPRLRSEARNSQRAASGGQAGCPFPTMTEQRNKMGGGKAEQVRTNRSPRSPIEMCRRLARPEARLCLLWRSRRECAGLMPTETRRDGRHAEKAPPVRARLSLRVILAYGPREGH